MAWSTRRIASASASVKPTAAPSTTSFRNADGFCRMRTVDTYSPYLSISCFGASSRWNSRSIFMMGAPSKKPSPFANSWRTTHRQHLKEWWKRFSSDLETRVNSGRQSPEVDRYVGQMLAARWKLSRPRFATPWNQYRDLESMLGLFTGMTSVREALQQDTFLKDTVDTEKPRHPLPDGVRSPSIPLPDLPQEVVVEDIALHVPADCLYLRCQRFADFLWLKSNLETWGGRIRHLVVGHSVDHGINAKVETQLALRETTMARVLGGTLVSDVAIVAGDPFVRDGAALGVLFETDSGAALEAVIAQQRTAAAETAQIKDETVNVDGNDVRLVSTSDNRVRSFYAISGRYHFVTNSKTLVQQFFKASAGQNSLGRLDEFRHARTLMPADKDDTAFVYISDPFVRRMVSPHYRVEMTRRLQAIRELEDLQVARLAAAAEQVPRATINDLIAARLLPQRFLTRTDGSQAQLHDDGSVSDSLRGGRGTFLPIADIDISAITDSELAAYREFASAYQAMWTRVDPVALRINRFEAGQREHVTFEFHISPYVKRHLGFLAQFLGPPVARQIAQTPNEVFAVEAQLGQSLVRIVDQETRVPAHHVFAGVHDIEAEFRISNGKIDGEYSGLPEPFYIGATPPINLAIDHSELDADGYAQIKKNTFLFSNDAWIRQFDQFRVHAPSRATLEAVTPHLAVEEAERPAQIRLRIGDLSQTKMDPLFNAGGYLQTRKASATTARLLNRLEQLRLSSSASAMADAERIQNARLVCPLGGKYLPKDGPVPTWQSDKWQYDTVAQIQEIPAGYRSPFLEWFHGLQIEFQIDPNVLQTRIDVELEPEHRPQPSAD